MTRAQEQPLSQCHCHGVISSGSGGASALSKLIEKLLHFDAGCQSGRGRRAGTSGAAGGGGGAAAAAAAGAGQKSAVRTHDHMIEIE
jgi:hypothetical protein